MIYLITIFLDFFSMCNFPFRLLQTGLICTKKWLSLFLINRLCFTFQTKFDWFVPAHLIGWWAKAIILRDFWFANVLSVLFEIYEYSLEHQLPNFHECWWDHVSKYLLASAELECMVQRHQEHVVFPSSFMLIICCSVYFPVISQINEN